MNFAAHLLTYFALYAIVSMSLNLVVGYCGLLTLSHAGYFAIGAYTYALMTLVWRWSFFPAAALGAVLAAALSLAVSLPAWRLRGDFFVLASLAVQALIFSGIANWFTTGAKLGSWRNLTNGTYGLSGVPPPSVLGWQAVSPSQTALFAVIIAAACGLLLRRIMVSPWGRLLIAMRDDELAARGLGKNTRFAKMEALAISCGVVSVAGALYAAHVGYLDPSSASLDESILMLSMVIVGGVGNLRGPIIGAATLVALPELLRFLALPETQAANARLMMYGLLLIILMHLRPEGIAGSRKAA